MSTPPSHSPSLPAVRPPRLQSVDALRGAIMILMAIDHIRDYVHRGAMQFLPTDLARTTTAIFFTRWITHFCAPVFMLTAGIGAYLWMQRGGHTKAELSRFLVIRGLWLILLELTVLRWAIFFQVSYRGSIVVLLILWAIGISLMSVAVLVHLPIRVLAVVSVAVILLHNFADPVQAASFGRGAWVWDILHQQGLFTVDSVNFVTGYPVLPWIGVVSAGYCLGVTFTWEAARRQRLLLRLGLALTALFFLVRAVNIYGDPSRWSHQSTGWFTVLSFLNTTKYPPSLDFLLMTLGPALIALSCLDNVRFRDTNPLIVFGRVPFFFYAAHFTLAHFASIALNAIRYGKQPFILLLPPSMGTPANQFPADFGYPLWVVYAVWLFVLLSLYPACLWFSRLKQRRRDWWLSYL